SSTRRILGMISIHRKFDGENTAFSDRTLQIDPALMRGHDMLDDGEPQTGSRSACGFCRRPSTVKSVKHEVPFLLGNAIPLVGHLDHRHPVSPLQRKGNMGPIRG